MLTLTLGEPGSPGGGGKPGGAGNPALASLKPKVMATAVIINMERIDFVRITAPFSTGSCFLFGKGSFPLWLCQSPGHTLSSFFEISPSIHRFRTADTEKPGLKYG